MIEIGTATEDEMVLAFLRGEIESPRFGALYKQCFDQLRPLGFNPQNLVENADIGSPRDNAQRIQVLEAVRGYRANQFLFSGFPSDVVWRRVGIEPTDWNMVKYANHSTWVTLSGGTRIVADGAKNIDFLAAAEDANKNIKAVADDLRSGKRYAELIGVEGEAGQIILAEATAAMLVKESAKVCDPGHEVSDLFGFRNKDRLSVIPETPSARRTLRLKRLPQDCSLHSSIREMSAFSFPCSDDPQVQLDHPQENDKNSLN